ncbi:MAG: relaxase/mobilization nuclease domain-containing protein [Bacteroidetes bacterium]|nr:relaxase/mobilization nuclease domain-containing protein [Bacteroidota bacterium]
MRPKITAPHNIARTLYYNEDKVKLGNAVCLRSANFLKTRPTPEDKLHALQKRMSLNERVSTCLHITLNFDPSDVMGDETMKQIADRYMKEIGFERQPYLVYRHHDAGHPHCHIVTTHVLPNGDPIELYNIGRNQSEQARQKIEEEFGLMTSERKKQLLLEKKYQLSLEGKYQTQAERITYGENSTTTAIAQVLQHVTNNFKCSSLEEFNTVLRLYNLEAYRGKENSKLYQNRGLLYRVLDENGRYIGVPLKASIFDCKPTLQNLEQRFRKNQSLKQEHRIYVEGNVGWAMDGDPSTFEEFREKLRRDQISIIIKRDKEGHCTNVTYINFFDKCVFNGDELEPYCNKLAIQKILDREASLTPEQIQELTQKQTHRHRLRPSF